MFQWPPSMFKSENIMKSWNDYFCTRSFSWISYYHTPTHSLPRTLIQTFLRPVIKVSSQLVNLHIWRFAGFGNICAILKKVKNTHGGVLLLAKLQVKATLVNGCFPHFLNVTNGTKSRIAYILKNFRV